MNDPLIWVIITLLVVFGVALAIAAFRKGDDDK